MTIVFQVLHHLLSSCHSIEKVSECIYDISLLLTRVMYILLYLTEPCLSLSFCLLYYHRALSLFKCALFCAPDTLWYYETTRVQYRYIQYYMSETPMHVCTWRDSLPRDDVVDVGGNIDRTDDRLGGGAVPPMRPMPVRYYFIWPVMIGCRYETYLGPDIMSANRSTCRKLIIWNMNSYDWCTGVGETRLKS